MLNKPHTLTESVAQQLANDIALAVYPVGAKLPAGRALARHYGVSAAVIREATERLRTQGLVQSRQGSGCVVIARTASSGFKVAVSPDGDRARLRDVYELRIELEGAAAALAAARRTDDDLRAMDQALQHLAQHLDDPVFASEHDLAFHEAIGVATHNPCYRQLLQYLNVQIRLAVRTAREHTLQRTGLSFAVHQEHVAIFEAIQAADPQGARAAAVRHLQSAARRLQLDFLH